MHGGKHLLDLVRRVAWQPGSGRRLWWRFPIELDADTIVVPDLFDFAGRPPAGYDCTLPPPRAFALFGGVSAAHLDYLRDEVAPRVARQVPHVVLVDLRRATFEAAGEARGDGSVRELPALLNGWLGAEVVERGAFDEVVEAAATAAGEETARRSPRRVRSRRGEDEDTPPRLWEACFWRGHAYTYELVDGEVPLVGDLGTPGAAERALRQCADDAERLAGAPARTAAGWRVAGRFRLRRLDALLEVRVRLTDADRRVAFEPRGSGRTASGPKRRSSGGTVSAPARRGSGGRTASAPRRRGSGCTASAPRRRGSGGTASAPEPRGSGGTASAPRRRGSAETASAPEPRGSGGTASPPERRARGSDETALPTLLGVLVAGGPNGKTELLGGRVLVTVKLRSPDEGPALADALRATIEGWCDAPACLPDRGGEGDAPDPRAWWISFDDEWLDVRVPVDHPPWGG